MIKDQCFFRCRTGIADRTRSVSVGVVTVVNGSSFYASQITDLPARGDAVQLGLARWSRAQDITAFEVKRPSGCAFRLCGWW